MSAIRGWLGKSTWALLDQCLFAFSNFLINLCLARWLDPESYGAFALAYTVFLFAGVFHSSVFTEPMLVFGPGRYKQSQKPYLQSLIRVHWAKGWPVAALLIGLVSVFYWNNSARFPILFLCGASGGLLFQWLIRRACYLQQQPALAAIGGAAYLALVLAGLAVVRQSGGLDAVPALLIMTLASLASGILIQSLLFRSGTLTEGPASPERELLEAHWNYGRWAIATGFVGWFSGNVAMVALPWWHGNAATGTFRAATNLILPIQQLLAAAGPLLLPFFVNRREDSHYLRIAFQCAVASTLAPLIWTVVLFYAGPLLGDLLYKGNYSFDRHFLLVLGLSCTSSSFGLIIATALRARELPKIAFRGYAAAAAVALAAGIPLIALYGINGAVWSLAVSSITCAAILTCSLVRHSRISATHAA
jgi:O-antigen/teichoic acid export membrane protein